MFVIGIVRLSRALGPVLVSGGLLVLAVLAAGTMAERLRRWPAFVAGPWCTALLVLIPPAIFGNLNLPLPAKSGITVLSALAIAGASALCHVLGVARDQRWSLPARLATIVTGIAIAGACAFGISSSRELNPRSAVTGLKTGATSPNVVLVVMDTVRGDHTSLLGYDRDTTPRLRELAGRATLFSNAFAVSDITLTTHASLFTGLYPRQHGAYCEGPVAETGHSLDAGFDTMAETLARHGYATVAAAANDIYLLPAWGLNQGFQVYDLPQPIPVKRDRVIGLRDYVRGILRRFIDVRDFDLRFQRAEAINRDALNLLDHLHQKGPSSFFLFLNYMDAHDPFVPAAPYEHKFGAVNPSWTYGQYHQLRYDALVTNHKVPPDVSALLSRLYDGGIAYEDEQLGKLFDQLKKLDLYDNTLIIVTADHGEGLGDSHAFSHPGSVYQEHIRIPLLVKFPHQHQPRVVQEPVSQIDVMPTVLATARLAVSSNLPGADLSAVEGMPPRDLLSVSYPCLSQRYPKLNRTSTAVISGGLKYIETSNGRRELYDLAHDPLELRNLYADDNRDTAVMSRALAAVLKTIPEYHRRLADREGLRFLKSLGYVQ